MSFRVIGGTFRNRPLHSPKGAQTRPTLAILRKAVFDICQDTIESAAFLDLFAGSGAMGIEAISRGAAHATFIEKDRNALKAIHENIKLLKIEKQTDVMGYEALAALKKLKSLKRSFDLVYIDPPYAASDSGELTVKLLGKVEELLNPGATVFLEVAAQSKLKPESLELERLRHVNTRTFSQSTLLQFRYA